MNIKKGIFLGLIILLILVISIFSLVGWRNIYLRISLTKFSKFIERESLDELDLTVYYMSPYILTPYPINIDDLVSRTYDKRIIISGSDLVSYIDLLHEISNSELIPVKQRTYLDERIYYVFETQKNKKVLDVAMSSYDDNIFVNGIEIESNRSFWEFIAQFLPETIAREFGIE